MIFLYVFIILLVVILLSSISVEFEIIGKNSDFTPVIQISMWYFIRFSIRSIPKGKTKNNQKTDFDMTLDKVKNILNIVKYAMTQLKWLINIKKIQLKSQILYKDAFTSTISFLAFNKFLQEIEFIAKNKGIQNVCFYVEPIYGSMENAINYYGYGKLKARIIFIIVATIRIVLNKDFKILMKGSGEK